MKKITLSLAFALVSKLVVAQFSTTGTITSTTDQVGIGTAAPNAQTEIASSPTTNLLLSKSYSGFNSGCPSMNLYLWARSKTTIQGVTTYDDLFSVNEAGNVGIGIKDAKYPFHIQRGSDYNQINAFFGTKAPANGATGSRNIFIVNKLNTGTSLIQRQNDQGLFWNDQQTKVSTNGMDCNFNQITIDNYYNASSGFVIAPVYLPLNAADFRGLRMDALGNVSIGYYETFTTSGLPNKFAVNGTIACKEINMDITYAWPDYVFKPAYKLMTLDSLSSFIKLKNHLPGIPTAVQIKQDGLQLGKMQQVTVEKVEELTLYIIEMNKRIQALEEQNKLLLEALLKK